MSWITSFTDTLNGLNPIFQWAIGLGCTFAIFFGMRYVMKTYILDIVKRTSFDWDDKLYSPVSTRLYTFIFVAGLKITPSKFLSVCLNKRGSQIPLYLLYKVNGTRG